jgi:hypothetical protein
VNKPIRTRSIRVVLSFASTLTLWLLASAVAGGGNAAHSFELRLRADLPALEQALVARGRVVPPSLYFPRAPTTDARQVDAEYADAVGDASGGRAPDISRVAVSNDGDGNIGIRLFYANRSCATSGDFAIVFLDTDENLTTPPGGIAYDYALYVDGTAGTRGIAIWNGTTYEPLSLASLRASCDAPGYDSWVLNRSDVGIASGFNFAVRTVSTDSAGTQYTDFGPGSPGIWNYQLSTPPPPPTTPPPDREPPTVRALVGTYRPGARALLRFRLRDDSNESRAVETVYGANGRVLGTIRAPFMDGANGRVFSISWRVPRGAAGRLKHCVRAWDRAGNASSRSCATLVRR